MTKIRISLFGRFETEVDDAHPLKIESQKAQELLCYLLLFRHRPHSREVIAEIFWANNSTDQAKSYLRRTLWQLHAAIESESVLVDNPLLLVEPDWLQLNPLAPFWLDVAILEKAYFAAKGIPGPQLDAGTANELRAAVELYQGNLLEGWYQNWCVFERERLLHIYLVLLDKLIRFCEAQGQYEAGIEYGMRALRQDQAREQSHRQVMRLHYLLRDRSGALRQYEWCVTALREELDVEPTKRTQELYQHIRLDLPDAVQDNLQEQRRSRSLEQNAFQPAISELKRIRDEISLLSARVDRVILAAENGSH